MSLLDYFTEDKTDKNQKPLVAVLTAKQWIGEFQRQLQDVTVKEETDREAFIKSATQADLAIIARSEQATSPSDLRKTLNALNEFDIPVAVCHNSVIAPHAMRWGADYFIMTDKQKYLGQNIPFHTINYQLLQRIIDKALHDKTDKEALDGLIIEKQEFYDYVAEEDLYDERAKKTANTAEEIRFLTEQFHDNDVHTVLDAGCGDGRIAKPLATHGYNVVGVDISEESIKKAKEAFEQENLRFEQGNLLHTRFDNASFDAIILMWHVICDLRHKQEDLIREMYRVLRPRGVLIFDFPDRAAHIDVDSEGRYENPVNNFMKYVGLVPDLRDIIMSLETLGFDEIRYERVNWGVDKFAVTAHKP